MVLVVLAGVFIMNTVSAGADPVLLIGKGAEQAYKYLFKQIGKEAAEKAMKKALKEAGEELTYKNLEKIGREAAEKAVIDANVKLTRKILMEGIKETGEKLSSTTLNKAYQMLDKAAVEALASEVKNKIVREASMDVLETGGRRTLGVATERGSIMYLTKTSNNILSLTTNQADAILLTPEMIEKYSVYLQKVFQTVRP